MVEGRYESLGQGTVQVGLNPLQGNVMLHELDMGLESCVTNLCVMLMIRFVTVIVLNKLGICKQ